jgi:biotin carboxylase
MTRRLLITGAGNGASNDLIRSLRTSDPSLFIVGYNSDRFTLKKSEADQNYLIPPSGRADFPSRLRSVINAEGIDLIIPTGDAEVELLSRLRDEIPCLVFLPTAKVIELCQDKYNLIAFLRDTGLPTTATHPVMHIDDIEEIFHRFAPQSILWCRIRNGSGSAGATPVKTPEQARGWIKYWQEMRGVPVASFTLSEYLPGRDFACQSIWQNGKLVLVRTHERVSYFGGANRPSGVASTAALAKTVVAPHVVAISTAAIRAIDETASGAFDVDLKEDARRVPQITEINAGRIISGAAIFDAAGEHSLALTYVRLALGESVEINEPYDVAEDYYFVRDVDTVPGVFHADELFEGIRELDS